jgi:hypothetical protein
MRHFSTTSACSGGYSAIRFGSRRATPSSTSWSASARNRSSTPSTRTRACVPVLRPSSMGCAGTPRSRSSAPSPISCTWPTLPKTSTTSAAAGSTNPRNRPPREGSFDFLLGSLDRAGIDAATLRATIERLLVSPVLTAHPTEVSRKSILSCQHDIARLLDSRDRLRMTPDERADSENALRAPGADPVADPHPATDPAGGHRRGEERHQLFR